MTSIHYNNQPSSYSDAESASDGFQVFLRVRRQVHLAKCDKVYRVGRKGNRFGAPSVSAFPVVRREAAPYPAPP